MAAALPNQLGVVIRQQPEESQYQRVIELVLCAQGPLPKTLPELDAQLKKHPQNFDVGRFEISLPPDEVARPGERKTPDTFFNLLEETLPAFLTDLVKHVLEDAF